MRRVIRAFAVAAFALASTLALLLANADGPAGVPATVYLRQALDALSGGPPLAALVFAVLCALNARFLFRPFAWRGGDRAKLALLSAVFALVLGISAAFRADQGVPSGFFSPAHALLLTGKAAGFFALFWVGMKAVMVSLPALARKLQPLPAPDARAVRRGFLLAWLLIAAAWLPSVLARFPGALTGDGGRVLQQYYREIIITSDHPVAYTFLMGLGMDAGRLLGSDNLGLFLCVLTQWLGLSAAMAWAAAALHREGFPPAARYAVVALSALSPLAMGWAATLIKDTPYSAVFVGFTVVFSRALLHPREAMRSRGWRVSYAALALGLLLLRHNGVLTVLPASALLLVRLLRADGSSRAGCGDRAGGRGYVGGSGYVSGSGRAWSAAALAAPLAAVLLFNTLVVARVAFPVDGTPDLLGVPIQQTARILQAYPDEATPERLAAIDRVLQAGALADAYVPTQSDSTRKLFRYFNGHTAADVLAFTGVWAQLAARHPLTAAQAFWALNGGFVDPLNPSKTAYASMMDKGTPKYPATLDIGHPESLSVLRQQLFAVEEIYRRLPGVSLLQTIGAYVWALWAMGYLVRRTRARAQGWLLLPAMATLLSCLLSAGYAVGARYALPIAFAAPYLVCLLGRAVLAEARGLEGVGDRREDDAGDRLAIDTADRAQLPPSVAGKADIV